MSSSRASQQAARSQASTTRRWCIPPLWRLAPVRRTDILSVLLACPDRADVPLPSAISTAVWTRDSENRPGHGRKKRYSTDLMNRYLAPITVVLLSLAGCVSQSQVPKCDPFFGRTTIPPPPTGSAAGRCADPYYQTLPGAQTPPPPQSPGCPPASSAAPASPPGAASTWAVPRGGAANASPPPSNPSSSAIAPSQLAPRPPSTAPLPRARRRRRPRMAIPRRQRLETRCLLPRRPRRRRRRLLLPRHREARAPAMAIPRRLALWAIVEYRYRERGPRLRGLTSRRLCRQAPAGVVCSTITCRGRRTTRPATGAWRGKSRSSAPCNRAAATMPRIARWWRSAICRRIARSRSRVRETHHPPWAAVRFTHPTTTACLQAWANDGRKKCLPHTI